MADMAASVLARLKNKAVESGRSKNFLELPFSAAIEDIEIVNDGQRL